MTGQRPAQGRKGTEFIAEYFRGKRVSSELSLRANASRARFAEQVFFDVRLMDDVNGFASMDSVFSGLYSSGRPSHFITGWVDGDYFDTVNFPSSISFSLNEAGLDRPFFRILGGLVPPGGSLMVSYSLFSKESKIHRETRQGLDMGYPPVVTALGFLLFIADCGMGFKDWYFAEGGREGPEKLQGYKPINTQMANEKAALMLQELRHFATIHHSDNDDLTRVCRSRAEQVMRVLQRHMQ